MRSTRKTAVLAALVLFLAGLALASCGGDGEEEPTTATTEPTTTETTTAPAPEQPTVVLIVVVNGSPQGGIVRQAVEQGDRVVVVVESDVADHVHVHGYDLVRAVSVGGAARIPFRATIPGRFEIELEDTGVRLGELTVRP